MINTSKAFINYIILVTNVNQLLHIENAILYYTYHHNIILK